MVVPHGVDTSDSDIPKFKKDRHVHQVKHPFSPDHRLSERAGVHHYR